MKKIALLALLCIAYIVPAFSQEVTYVEDPAQGYLFNRMRDNWFIDAEGGVGIFMSRYDSKADFKDRLGAKVNLHIGKWFSPLIGVRFGGDFEQLKGATWVGNYAALGYRCWPELYKDGKYAPTHFNDVGVTGDVLFNVSNWLFAYKPNRFYNAIFYVGVDANWVFAREGARPVSDGKWSYGANDDEDHCRNYSVHGGLLNSFAITKRFDLLLDMRFDFLQEHSDGAGMGYRTWNEYPSLMVGISYKIGKTDWNAPVLAVCPEWRYTDAEGDDLTARLNDANNKINDLEQQLRKCLERKPEAASLVPGGAVADAPLATVYFPINRTDVLGVQRNVVNAVAEVMKNESRDYVLTGWADNYTGNDEINTRLRKGRVATVKKELVNKGVADGRLETQINAGNLTNYGPKCASLDRAVTIHRK